MVVKTQATVEDLYSEGDYGTKTDRK